MFLAPCLLLSVKWDRQVGSANSLVSGEQEQSVQCVESQVEHRWVKQWIKLRFLSNLVQLKKNILEEKVAVFPANTTVAFSHVEFLVSGISHCS